jgi:hypothetical protein
VGPGLARILARVWLLTTGVCGLALLFFWVGTDHAVASMNLNLLVLNPLWLWPAIRRGADWRMLPLMAGFSALALVMPLLPPQQYTLDVLAAILPLNLAAAATLTGARPARGPSPR